ncbi:hypothetical protein JZO77_10075 [Enterococcus hulanensis]|uniref:hypothetical protein n=1 Tax=Enterococcus hulanensis TaxID=2559929 RepID=UPI001A8F03DD|nr:hypothetical protein [Enterococcus hulanensis]MBO0457080.1 hypothetical protein [Enterococcus hulanensis]
MVKIVALVSFAGFYFIYLSKAILLKKHGIKVNLLGDKEDSKEKYFEIFLRVMTGLGGIFQFLAPFLFKANQTGWVYLGLGMTIFSVFLFFIAVVLFDQQIRGEEKFLLMTFGDCYRQYQAAVRRYF